MDKKDNLVKEELNQLLKEIGFELFFYHEKLIKIYFKYNEYTIQILNTRYETIRYIISTTDYIKLYDTLDKTMFKSFLKEKYS